MTADPRTRPFRRLSWLVLALLAMTPAARAGVPALPAEDAPSSSVTPANPDAPHAAEASGAAQVTGPFTVRFADAAQASPPEVPTQARSHVQGELVQHGPTGTGASLGGETPPPAGPPPETAADAPEAPAALAPGDPITEFAGLSYTGWYPPDTVVATGPSHVVEAVNSGFAVYSKTGGSLQGYTTFSSFFSPLLPSGWSGSLFDPRVVYTVAGGSHFVMLAIGRDSVNQDSLVFVAVSQTTDPTGTWWIYSYTPESANPSDADSWADYCGLGADEWGIYVTCNLFRWTGYFKYARLWSLNPAMYSGGSGNGWTFWDLQWNSGSTAFALQPVTPYSSASDQATFFVNTFSSSGSQILLWKMTGDRTSSPTLTRATISTATYNAIGQNVDQPGSSTDIDGGDARVMNGAYMNRKVYAVLTDDVNNDGRASGWRLFRLDVDGNSLDWQDLTWSSTTASTGGFYYFYPAITLDGSDLSDPNLAIYGSWTDTETAATSATRYASGLFKVFDDQPNSDSGPFVSFEAGDASYVRLDSINRNRWGDYSGAAYDWTTGNVWGAVEVASTSNLWRTRIHSMEISGACGDGYEPDDSSGQASSISSGAVQSHSICPAGDEDWVRFTLAGESAVNLETSGPSGDTRMWLYDSGLSQVDFDDDGGSGLFSKIDRVCGVDALPAGTYYVKVDEYGGDDTISSYNLGFTITEACAGSCQSDLVLSNTNLSGTQSYRASNSITLGPSLVIDGTAIDLLAGQKVIFTSGTAIGGTFSAGTHVNACTQ